jgi:hypothetical protein
MSGESHSHPDPRGVSTLLELQDVHRHDWSSEELRQIVRHQLTAPLSMSLGTLSGEVAHRLRESREPMSSMTTLAELLRQARPPLELLRLIKRFAKTCRSDRYNSLPAELVMLLYYASISAALVRLGQPISDLPPASLRRGMTWLSDQSWVEEEVKSLLRDGLRYVDTHCTASAAGDTPREERS